MACVFVALDDKPGGSVGDAKIDDFTGSDKVVESVHQFRDGRGIVPEMHIVLLIPLARICYTLAWLVLTMSRYVVRRFLSDLSMEVWIFFALLPL